MEGLPFIWLAAWAGPPEQQGQPQDSREGWGLGGETGGRRKGEQRPRMNVTGGGPAP